MNHLPGPIRFLAPKNAVGRLAYILLLTNQQLKIKIQRKIAECILSIPRLKSVITFIRCMNAFKSETIYPLKDSPNY